MNPKRRLLKYDPLERKRIYMDFSDPDAQFTIVTEYETDHILNYTKAKANEWRRGSLIGNTQRHYQKVAELPNDIYAHLREKYGPLHQNPKAWKKWLNDIDNMHWRTGGGHL